MATLLEDLTSGDPTRVWSGTCAVVTLRDADALDALSDHLGDIKRATTGVDLGGALYPNSERLDFAVRKLEYHRDRAGCLCRLYPEYLMYDPRKEEAAGNVQIEAMSHADWAGEYTCRCTVCGTRYAVEEREYHYTWWGWSVAAEPGVLPDGPAPRP